LVCHLAHIAAQLFEIRKTAQLTPTAVRLGLEMYKSR